MRWWWIDRFLEFESGKYAKSVKNVSISEEQLDDYVPGHPVMPASLVIEGLAQTGGLLVGQMSDFERSVVLAKVSKAKFHAAMRPGDQLIYTAILENVQPDGALACCTVHVGDELRAEIDLYFAFFDNRNLQREQFVPAEFMRMMRVFRLFDVGVDREGQPIPIPKRLLDAERRDLE